MNTNVTEKDPAVLVIVSPCYNEEQVIEESVHRLSCLMQSLIDQKKISHKSFILFVNDGSKDSTWSIIEKLHATSQLICGVNLTYNVGHQRALYAGLMTAREYADVVISIDADIQDDLEAIPKMLDQYSQGSEVVYGVKVSRTADSFLKRNSANLFYAVQRWMGVKAIRNHADFRLMSKLALTQLSKYNESNLYLRGVIYQLGLPHSTVDDVISERQAGESKYTLGKMVNLAMDGITSFSIKPLRIITLIGFVFLLVGIGISIDSLIAYTKGQVIPGWTSVILSLWIIGSVIVISLGVIGEYIGRIYMEVKARPRYDISKILLQEKEQEPV